MDENSGFPDPRSHRREGRFHSTPIIGTTLAVFSLDGAGPWFQITRLFLGFGSTFSQAAWNRWTENAAPLIRRRRHHVVSREPQDNWLYLFS